MSAYFVRFSDLRGLRLDLLYADTPYSPYVPYVQYVLYTDTPIHRYADTLH